MSKKITIKLDGRTGNVTVKPEGYKGDECFKATEGLERGLNMKGNVENTPEFYEQPERSKELN